MLRRITHSNIQLIIRSKCHCASRMITMRSRYIIQDNSHINADIFFIRKSDYSINWITITLNCCIVQNIQNDY